MKRLIVIGLSLLMLVGFSANAVAMSDSAKQNYQTFVKNSQRKDAALAVDASGCWAASRGWGTSQAEYYALEQCASKCGSTCVIKDVNGKSAFIKQRGSSSSSSTASSSGKVWCVLSGDYFQTQSGSQCIKLGGLRMEAAEIISLRELRNCYDSSRNFFYKSARCSGSDKEISKREYRNRRLSSSSTTTTASNSSVSNKGWCARTTGVRYEEKDNCTRTDGEWFTTRSNAVSSKRKQLKAASSTASSSSSTSSSSGKVWCVISEDYFQTQSGSQCIKLRGLRMESEGQAQEATGKSSPSNISDITAQTYWCVSKREITRTTKRRCVLRSGKTFSSKYQAQAEHKRLKAASSTASSSTTSSSNWVWCATALSVKRISESACKIEGGTGYPVRAGNSSPPAEASIEHHRLKAEHKRLKSGTTPEVKTASLTIRSNVTGDKVYIDGNFKGSTRLDLKLSKGRHTIRIEKDGYKTYEESINLTDNLIIRGHLIKIVDQPVQTVVVDNTVEVEFWDSIKGNDDPDEYRIYLDEYPTGKFAKLAKLRIKKLGGTTTSVAQSSIPKLNYGDYYALVIGNNRYEHFRNLRTAVNDARTVSNLLKNDYGFDVTLLENATRSQILDSIINLKNRVSRSDNVVVYYAGHGQLDPDTDEGFWIPVDADPDSQSNWLLTDRVRSQIKAMRAKHVMVVADSCFSGKFTRSAITRGLKIKPRSSEYVPALQRLIDKKSRTALTSGGLEPVLDSSSGGDHSVFAEAFISILSDNEGVLDAAGLFSQLRPKVINNSDQTPEYSTIHQGGHDGGDFLFVRQ